MMGDLSRPPVADVRGLTGTFEFTGDSVWWKGARVTFPATKASGDGRYYMASGDLHLRLHGDPIRPADIRWAMPNLPENGSGKLDFGLDWTGEKSVYLARNMDVTLDGSHILRARYTLDRKSTRLNSSHLGISYAVFCLKKKKKAGVHHAG